MQFDLFESPAQPWQAIPNGKILFQPQFLTTSKADTLFSQLRSSLAWKQESIRMFGKSVLQPRLQAWYGDAAYTYSGLTMIPLPWNPQLLTIKQRAECAASAPFNSVLANLYRDGQDYMGWHQDNEPELGQQPIIASVNLGATRCFVLRHIETKSKIEYTLSHGSLLVMAGDLQTHWQHTVPKSTRVDQERINLTFRHIITQ